jgi:hypothetical protein
MCVALGKEKPFKPFSETLVRSKQRKNTNVNELISL